MITSATFFNPATGIRTTVRRSGGGTHGHWAVFQNSKTGLWCLQWAYREGLGTRYEPPWPTHRGLATRKAAEAIKVELRVAGTEGWGGPPAAAEVP